MLRLSLCLAALTPLALSTPLAAQAVQTLNFARGASGTTIAGAVKGYDYRDYKISLKAGQKLSVALTRLGGSPYFNVMEPGEKDVAVFVGSSAGDRASLVTARGGAYTIRVYQMRSTARRGEVARYRLSVSAEGRGGGNGPGDAVVAGTPYHATANVRCRVDASGRWGDCKAGVTRRGPGAASVHLDTIDGGQRTILFGDGRALSSDADTPIRVTRRGDTSIVAIGRYEVYEIPDALPFGG